jgi:hypothetical protein
MTLVLSAVTQGVAVQVADRLVSLQRGQRLEALDESANKLIVYVARDAHVSIAYAGQAFVGRLPTDEFIAEILTGRKFTRGPGEMCGIRLGGKTPRYDIGLAVKKIVEGLVPSIRPKQIIQLSIVGHHWDRHNWLSPMAMRIELSSNGVQAFQKLPRSVPPGFALVTAIGVQPSPEEMAEISKSIFQTPSVKTLEDVAVTLTDAIRRNGAPGIGLHTSAALLPSPGHAPIETGFYPVTPHFAILRGGGNALPFVADISPWIIAPGITKPPSHEIGGMNYSAGGLEFVTKGTPDRPPADGGLLFALSTMPRFELPTHLRS